MSDSEKSSRSAFYVATSIPYVNGAPHVGHAMEFVLADIFARYNAQQGSDVFFSTGSDEHGGKIMDTAKAQGKTPMEFATENAQAFKDLAKSLNVEYTKFIRTTDSDHETRAAMIWKNLSDAIYKSSYSGMYDQKEETFLTHEEAKQIQKEDPERFARLTELKEENYFFKLSFYTEHIKARIEAGDMQIVPTTRKNEIMALLDRGLDDISVSRPTEKIPWGIPVPGDESQTMYVWFEALMNYITTLGYPDGLDMQKFWPADVHVIGKDISRFHCAIWPAMLLGLGLAVPKTIYIHGFINDKNGDIMSKSKGNGISPDEVLSQYGADMFRYYVARHIPSGEDNDFSWERYETIYNTELGNELGNLVQRTASMIERYQDGVIGNMPESMHDVGPYHDFVADFRLDQALDYVWTLVRGMNQYIEEEKPWQIAKEQDAEHLQEVLAYVASACLQIADLLQPTMPETASKIVKIFGTGLINLDSENTLFPRVSNYTVAGKQNQK